VEVSDIDVSDENAVQWPLVVVWYRPNIVVAR